MAEKISHGGDIEWAAWNGHGGARVACSLPGHVRARNCGYVPPADRRLPLDEYAGLFTEGRPCEKNGEPFEVTDDWVDGRDLVSVGDIIGYPNSARKYRITFVDRWTVHMKRDSGAEETAEARG